MQQNNKYQLLLETTKGCEFQKKELPLSESPALSDRSQIQQPETTEPEQPIVPVVVTPEVEVPLPEPPQAQATPPPPPPPEPVPTEEEKQRAARLHLVHVHFKLMLYRFEEAKSCAVLPSFKSH